MKPILFNTEMVRAILEGRKTVTRRPVKFGRGQNPAWSGYVPDGGVLYGSNNIPAVKAPYQLGDILWVRETWCESLGQAGKYFYRAYAGPRDEMKEYAHSFNRWHPSIHMPRDAARLFLRVTEVRANKLHDVNYFDCLSEGVPYRQMETDIVQDFSALWDSTIKPADRPVYGWAANPWVWIIQFERISRPPEGEEEKP